MTNTPSVNFATPVIHFLESVKFIDVSDNINKTCSVNPIPPNLESGHYIFHEEKSYMVCKIISIENSNVNLLVAQVNKPALHVRIKWDNMPIIDWESTQINFNYKDQNKAVIKDIKFDFVP